MHFIVVHWTFYKTTDAVGFLKTRFHKTNSHGTGCFKDFKVALYKKF